ncbi:non-structural maintenance of chromosomes element 3 homolog isoform X1 [Colletes gigas]|uniref:non-structural maintenance of chromosomes element 3 homolog isoform X1 n=1 Tax=Colletes gigas TaxID=935657 RepID=UPI001C9B6E0A|nr:non-structural maintenance of chromosomes element 3 homolog isoform X1 [Colletes gigas]
MGLPQKGKSSLHQTKFLSQTSNRPRIKNVTTLSQPLQSRSRNNQTMRHNRREHVDEELFMADEVENQRVCTLIKYFFALDKKKQIISKSRIIKNIFGNQGKHFHKVMTEAKNILSKVFGYHLVELEGNKYMLANEIANATSHIRLSESQSKQQILLFLVLTHIFMLEGSSTKELLWQFLKNLGITCSDNTHHYYFGNVVHYIDEIFVAQKYLDKIVVDKDDSSKIEYKWGPRAEYEFSRRACLEFMSEVYNGRPIQNWPLQCKTMIAREKSKNLH